MGVYVCVHVLQAPPGKSHSLILSIASYESPWKYKEKQICRLQ